MADGLDKPTLDSDINSAFKKARDAGQQTGASPNDIFSTLATDLAKAIRTYMETAKVVTEHEIPSGQVAAGGAGAAGPGATTGPGKCAGPSEGEGSNGNLLYTDQDETKLKWDIEQAYKNAKEAGEQTGAVTDTVTMTLGKVMADAIHDFMLKGKTETVYDIEGGVTVGGYLSASGSPIKADTEAGTGTADGTLS